MTTETSGQCVQCVNCSSTFRPSKRNNDGQKGEDGVCEIAVKVEVPFVNADSDTDDDDVDILSWEMTTQRFNVEEALRAIYKLQFLKNNTKLSSSSTISNKNHNNNNSNTMKICEKCADVLKNLYQYYLKFGQLREKTSSLAKSIEVVDSVLELQQEIYLKLQPHCDDYENVDDQEEEEDYHDTDDDRRDDDDDDDDDEIRNDDNDTNANASDKNSIDNTTRAPVSSSSSSKVILSSSSLFKKISKSYRPLSSPPSPPHAKSVLILLRSKRPHSPVHQPGKEGIDSVIDNKNNNSEKRMRSTSGSTSSTSNTHSTKNIMELDSATTDNEHGEIGNELICGDIMLPSDPDDDDDNEIDPQIPENPVSSPPLSDVDINYEDDVIDTEMVTVKVDPTDILLGIDQNNFDPAAVRNVGVGVSHVSAKEDGHQPPNNVQTYQLINNVQTQPQDVSTESQRSIRKQKFSDVSHRDEMISHADIRMSKRPGTILKCPYCRKAFGLRKDLIGHSLVEHGHLIYSCPLDDCASFFTKFSTVEQHKRECHQIYTNN